MLKGASETFRQTQAFGNSEPPNPLTGRSVALPGSVTVLPGGRGQKRAILFPIPGDDRKAVDGGPIECNARHWRGQWSGSDHGRCARPKSPWSTSKSRAHRDRAHAGAARIWPSALPLMHATSLSRNLPGSYTNPTSNRTSPCLTKIRAQQMPLMIGLLLSSYRYILACATSLVRS